MNIFRLGDEREGEDRDGQRDELITCLLACTREIPHDVVKTQCYKAMVLGRKREREREGEGEGEGERDTHTH